MKYQVGEIGRVILARFEDGDAIISNLNEIVRKENIRGCIFYLLGGITEGRIVVGPANDDVRPPEPTWREIVDGHETLAIGTVFWHHDEPRVHIHGTYGKFDSVKTGCLRDEAKTFLILEAIIIELKGIKAVRDIDPVIQMTLLKLLDR
ncbi:MAG: PPC domain-containing DNA-binding protein [Syntrophorhabdaceae bacterium]